MAMPADVSSQSLKEALGKRAADLIQDGMLVGIGTGTTAACFINSLIIRCQQGLRITGVATSEASYKQAAAGGIPMADLNDVPELDIAVDGADEIDPQKRMIKGAGGALLREKIIALSSREMVVVVEQRKLVKQLGKMPLPVEIVPFGYKTTLRRLNAAGYHASMRLSHDGQLYRTDNHNYICDIQFDSLRSDPEKDQERIINITGVVDTGFFFNIAGRVLVATPQGQVLIKQDLTS